MDWLEQFAVDRSQRLVDFDKEIHDIVVKGLGQYGAGTWYSDIVEGASVLWLEIFEKSDPNGDPAGSIDTFQREIGESLAKTTQPSTPPTDGEINRVANWVGVYTVNSASYRAGITAGVIEKIWIDMEDDRVRPTHRAAHNQTVPIRGTFDIGGYKLLFPGEPVGPPEIWINCRCLIATTGGDSMSTKTITAAATDQDPDVDEEGDGIHVDPGAPVEDDPRVDTDPLVDDDSSTPWHGVLVVEGVETGDHRIFDDGALSYGTLPLPISWQRMSADGHMQSVVVGRIDDIQKVGNEHRATGMFNLNVPEANEVVDGIVFGMLGGVSVDVDSSEFTLEYDEDEEGDDDIMGMLFGGGGPALTRFTAGRIRGASLVSIPAFQEAYIALGDSFDESPRDPQTAVGDAAPGEDDADGEYEVLEEIDLTSEQEAAFAALFAAFEEAQQEEVDSAYALVASAFAPGTHDGPGWITNPRSTQRLRSYWVHGEGAAKIRWGEPGDFNRCRLQLGKYVNPAFLAGTCANLHKEALKVWPGRERGDKHSGEVSPAFALVASGNFELTPIDAKFFANPELTEPTPMTITNDGHIFGHVAQWGTCHIGIGEKCIMAPHSKSEYAHFTRGIVDTTEGPVRTGALVMWTGHAGTNLAAYKATRHYDDTGFAVADIAMGEDVFGPWFSGRLRDDASEDDIRVLKATGTVSGDWRDVNRTGVPDEMIGLLAVNVPGYDMPRVAFAMDGDRQVSLIASGGIMAPRKQTTEPKSLLAAGYSAEDLHQIGRVVADELEYRAERKERLASVRDPELMELATGRREARIAAAKTIE